MKSTKATGSEGSIFRRGRGGTARRRLAVESFSDLLSEEQFKDLGPVSESWFEDLTTEALCRDREAKQQDDLQTPLKSHHHDNSQIDTSDTPVHDGTVHSTPFGCSPSLFSPNVPECSGRDLRSRLRSEVDVGQSTPVLPPSGKKFLSFSGVSQLRAEEHGTTGYIQPRVGLSPGVGLSPLPSLTQTESPVLSRRLFKTPQGLPIEGLLRNPIGSRFLPTPERLTLTLGGDLDSSSLSWTSSMATPTAAMATSTAAMATPTAAMATPTAAIATPTASEGSCDLEEDDGLATDGKKLARALFIQCDEETNEDPTQETTQDNSQPEENNLHPVPVQSFQSQTDLTLTQEFCSTLRQTSPAPKGTRTVSETCEAIDERNRQNCGLSGTQEAKVARKTEKPSGLSQSVSSQNCTQNVVDKQSDVDKTLDFLFAKSGRKSQSKVPPPPKRRKFDRATKESLSEAASKHHDSQPATDAYQEVNSSNATILTSEVSNLDYSKDTVETQKITKPSNSVEDTRGKRSEESPANVDFFSQISPSSMQAICQAADNAAAKVGKGDLSDKCQEERLVRSTTSNCQVDENGVTSKEELSLTKETKMDRNATPSIGLADNVACSTAKDAKNFDVQSDKVGFSKSVSPPANNPTQGTLDVMSVSSQVFKQQTQVSLPAQEGHLAAVGGTAREEGSHITKQAASKQQKQTATTSLVFNLKVPAKTNILQNTPKLSMAASVSALKKGGTSRRFFYPTSSQIAKTTPKTLFPSKLVNEKKSVAVVGSDRPSAIPRNTFGLSLEQSREHNSFKMGDVNGSSSKTFMSADSSTSSKRINSKEYIKDYMKLNTKPLSNQPVQANGDLNKHETEDFENQSKGSVLRSNALQTSQDFRSLSNNPLTVSAKPVKKTAMLGLEGKVESAAMSHPVEDTMSSKHQGFCTASNKPIHVSSGALEKARVLIEEVEMTLVEESLKPDSMQERTSSSDSTKTNFLSSYGRFQTASRKKIAISEGAMKKAAVLAAEVDAEMAKTSSRMFEESALVDTVSTKDIDIARNSIQKEIRRGPEVYASSETAEKDKGLKSGNEFVGFRTASSKRIDISDKAMKRAEALFSEVDDSILAEMMEQTGNMYDAAIKSGSISADKTDVPTGKGCSVDAIAEVQEPSKSKLPISNLGQGRKPSSYSDLQLGLHNVADYSGASNLKVEERTKQQSSLQEFTGFQTASKKPIGVSEGAMKRAKTLVKEVETSLANEAQWIAKGEQTPTLNSTGIPSTSTGQSQQSSNGIGKLHVVTAKLEDSLGTETRKQENSHSDSVHLTGFTTASRKPIHISSDAKRKAKSLAAEVEASLTPDNEKHQVEDKTVKQDITGFTTASKKKIKVSSSSLQKARVLTAEVEASLAKSTSNGYASDQNSAAACPGFRTASNKNTSVSTQAMQKARLLLAEVDTESAEKFSNTKHPAKKPGEIDSTKTRSESKKENTLPHRGFQPFNHPAKLLDPKMRTESPNSHSGLNSVKSTASSNSVIRSMGTVAAISSKPSQPMKENSRMTDSYHGNQDQVLNDSFHDDHLFCTQMVSAAEVAESTYAFLQAERENEGCDDFGFPDQNQNQAKSLNVDTTSLTDCARKVSLKDNVDSKSKKERQSKGSLTKEKQQKAVSDPKTEGNHRNTEDENSTESTEFAAVGSYGHLKSFDQHTTTQQNDRSKSEEVQTTSHKVQQEHIVSNNEAQTFQKKTVCNVVKDTDAALLDESFDLAWGVVDELVVKAMEASAQISAATGQDTQAEAGEHRHSLDSGLGDSRITSQRNNVSVASCSSLEQQRHNSTLPSQDIGPNTEEIAVNKDVQDHIELYKSSQCPFTTAGGRKVCVSEESLTHVREMAKETFLPPEEISVPLNKLSRDAALQSSNKVSHLSFMEHQRETLHVDNQLENDDKDSSNHVGFRTAGGRKVNVSETSLQKARQLWDSTEQAEKKWKTSPSGKVDGLPKFEGFQTASGHKVDVSDKALAKARLLWNKTRELEEGLVSGNQGISNLQGFKTASGNRVKISENALQKAREMWKETERQEDTLTPKMDACTSKFPGFHTASGHKVAVSEEALQKAQHLWDETDKEDTDGCKEAVVRGKRMLHDENEKCNSQKDVSVDPVKFGGFTTAAGKSVQVSKQALQKAKQLWDGIDKNDTSHKENSLGFHGFHTASGKNVDVSEQALSRARQLWRDTERDSGDETKGSDATNKSSPKCTDFQTAGGKKVQVSTEALQKAKMLWKDEVGKTDPESSMETMESGCLNDTKLNVAGAQEKEEVGNKDVAQSSRNVFEGFKTARGSTVQVSKTSLQQARKMFQDMDGTMECSPAKGPTDNCTSSRCQGFTTARGQNIQVSKESLQFAKDLWKESACSSVAERSMETKQLPKFRGFHTANGQKVEISDDALERARAQLAETTENTESLSGKSDIAPYRKTGEGQRADISEEMLQKSGVFSDKTHPDGFDYADKLHCNTTFRGFQTAKGERIEVSKEALQKARALFSDEASLAGTDTPGKSTLTGQEQITNGTKFKGFQTAKGQRIEVSNEALQKARALFSDESSLAGSDTPEKSTLTCQEQFSDGKKFKGFQTAGGKRVEVTEDALKKARDLFSEEVREENADQKMQVIEMQSKQYSNSSMFRGFQTAAGKQVKVSEEALKKARASLSEDNVQDKSVELHAGFAECVKLSPEQQGSVQTVLPPREDKDRLGTKFGVPLDRKELLNRDRTARKRTLSSLEGQAVFPPSKRQSALSAGQQGQPVRHRQAFRPPVATHPEGVVQDRHGFSVRTRLLPLHSRPQQDVSRRPSGVPQPTRQPVLSTPQAHNTAESSFKVPFKSPVVATEPAFSTPFKTKPERVDGKPEGLQDSTSDNVTDNLQSNQDICKDDGSGQNVVGIVTENQGKPQALRKAREAQALRIAQKKKQAVRPEYGSLLQKRLTQPRVGLREAVSGQTPDSYTAEELYSYGVHPSTCTVTSDTAESFRFVCGDHFSPATLDRGEGVALTDGGVLVPREDDTAGKEEFTSALLDTPGVDPGLVTADWIHNHYRWIVWKLAAMEMVFPVQFGGRCLTPDQVLMQLKYRYDREVDLAQRSALKKILERDDTPSKTLVLCVARILPQASLQGCASDVDSKKMPQKESIIELTDGWYGVRTTLDPPLARLVESKHIYVGQKLCLSGAELVGSQDACSPLEAPANLLLKLSANATRPARWDAKLGYYRNPQPYPVSLGSLSAEGGTVGCVDVVVLRIYPMQYMEKYPSGTSVFRSSRAEERAARKHEEDRNRRMEKLYTQIQDRFERRTVGRGSSVGRRRKSLHLKTEDIENLQTGQEIYEALQGAVDPTEIEQCLSPAQQSRLYDHQRSLQAEQQGELQAEFRRALQQLDDEIPAQRNVVAMYRVRLGDYHREKAGNTELTLTVWRPTDHVVDMLKEGKRLKVFHLSTSAARNQVQLASTRTTRYQELPVEPDALEEVYTPRKLATYEELCASDFRAPCGEVDIVGVVVYITGLSATANSSGVQTVYLADADQNLCCVKFWGGVTTHSLEDILKPRALVAGANLQWRPDDRLKVPCLMFGDQSDFSQKPQHSHLREGLRKLEETVKDVKSFTDSMVQEVERVVYSRQVFSPGPVHTSRAWASPNPGNRTGFLSPNTPAARLFTPARACSTPNNNVTKPRPLQSLGFDAQVTPCGRTTSISSSVQQSSGKSSVGAHTRMNLLDRVPSPPPLATLVSPIPHRVKRAFKRPGLAPLHSGRGSPGFVPPVKRAPDVEGKTGESKNAANTTDLELGNSAEITDAEMASICTQNTPSKQEECLTGGKDQERTINVHAQEDITEDFISDTQLLTAFNNEDGSRADSQPKVESLGDTVEGSEKTVSLCIDDSNTEASEQTLPLNSPMILKLESSDSRKQTRPLQGRRGCGLRRRGRGRRGKNSQGARTTAVHSTDVQMSESQTAPEQCTDTAPEEERVAIPEVEGATYTCDTVDTIDTVTIEDGPDGDGIETKVAQNTPGNSQGSSDSQNVATRTRSSLRLAKKRKR